MCSCPFVEQRVHGCVGKENFVTTFKRLRIISVITIFITGKKLQGENRFIQPIGYSQRQGRVGQRKRQREERKRETHKKRWKKTIPIATGYRPQIQNSCLFVQMYGKWESEGKMIDVHMHSICYLYHLPLKSSINPPRHIEHSY